MLCTLINKKYCESTVKTIGMVFAMCMFAAAIGAEQPDAPTAPEMDAAMVAGGEFESTGFKFHYELPKGWKALDDAKRVAANQQLRDQYAHPVHSPNVRAGKKPLPMKKTTDPTIGDAPKRPVVPAVPNNFSLMVASPNGVDSVDSAVLPRINIWANHKIPAINSARDRALVLESLGRVVLPTTLVSLAGREFARVEVLHSGGPYHSLWVTAAGDYLIGFDVRSGSETELQALLETMRSVRFD
jgi:hypothetical protein